MNNKSSCVSSQCICWFYKYKCNFSRCTIWNMLKKKFDFGYSRVCGFIWQFNTICVCVCVCVCVCITDINVQELLKILKPNINIQMFSKLIFQSHSYS